MADEIIIKVNLEGANEQLNTLNALQEEINALAQEKKKLSAAEKDLAKAIEKGTVSQDEATATAKDLAEQQVKNNLILKETKKEFQATEKAVINGAKANRVNEGSIAQMRLEVSKAQKEYVNLSKAERDNEKIGGALQKQIKEQNDELKELEKNVGINGRSVGDYGQAVEGVLPLMGGFGQQIQSIIGSLGGIKTAIGKFSTAQKGLLTSTKATNGGLKAFRIALISTGIGAIVVALGALIAAFLSTQRGVDALTSVLRPLQEIMNSILGLVQNLATSGLDRLKKAFSDPKQAVIDLGKAIKDNLITRILAVPKLIKAAASAYINAFKVIGLGIKKVLADVPLIGKFIDKEQLEKDLTAAKEAVTSSFSELKDASIELSIGVDADKVKAAGAEAAKFFSEAAARGTEIDKLTKEIERAAITLNREREKGLLIFEQQRSIAEDTLKTDQERLVAARKAQEAIKKTDELEIAQLNRKIALEKLKTEGSDTDRETQEAIQDLIAEREKVESDGIRRVLELRNKANAIVSAREKTNKKLAEDKVKADEKAGKDQLKRESELIDKQIEALELARQLELATIDETNEEKLKKEAELLDAISKLRIDKAEKDGQLKAEEATKDIEDSVERETTKSKIVAEAVLEQENKNEVIKAEAEKAIQDEKDEKEKERLQANEDFKREVNAATANIIADSGKALLNGFESRSNREKEIELANLDAKLQNGLITQEEFEKKKLEIEKAAFNRKKKLDIAVIAIDLAKELSAIAAAAAANPANAVSFGAAGVSQAAVLSGLAVARSGIQAGIVASQKFSRGGVIHGASHAFGGVNLGNNQEGEGGEAIINKRSTAKHLLLLSAINQDGGNGVPLGGIASPSLGALTKFGNGGIINNVTNQGSALDMEELKQAFSDSINTIKVQNVASETTEVANRVQSIEDSASF